MNLGGTIRLNRTGLCILLVIFLLLMLYITSNKTNIPNNDENTKDISLRQLLFTAIETAQRGGTEIKNLKGPLDVKSKGKTKEGVNDSVSNADLKSHCAMYETIKQTFPHIRIISEENHECQDVHNLKVDITNIGSLSDVLDITVPVHDITVWIDPLDATKEYLENLFQYVTTMVCVAVKGKPVIGVIYKPFSNKTSWAWVDKIQSEDLKKPPEPTNESQKIIISMSHAGEAKEILKKALGENVEIVQAAGAGYKTLEVTAGNVDAYFHSSSIKKWDICAGNAIIKALGGKMTTSFNDDIDYSNAGKVVNDKGLLATIYNHDSYIQKFMKVKN